MIYLGRLQIACLENVALLAIEASSLEAAREYFAGMLGAIYESMAQIMGIPLPPEMSEAGYARFRQQVLDGTRCPACGECQLAIRLGDAYHSMEELTRDLGRFGEPPEGKLHAPSLFVTHALKAVRRGGESSVFRRPPMEKVKNN